VTSQRKITTNRHNSRNSCGPRTAAGKRRASRNAQRHGLAAINHRRPVFSDEIERLARAICGDNEDPALFAQAMAVAENELTLRRIHEQEVHCVERLRELSATPYAEKDSGIGLAKAISQRAQLAYDEIGLLLPGLLEKYKDQPPNWETGARETGEIVPLRLKVLLQSFESMEEEERAVDLARKQIKERDEFEAFEKAAIDLIRLNRYERRARSRQKRAIRAFMNVKLMGDANEHRLK
jgi:hypothetical protein